MKSVTKILALLLALVLCVSVLAACETKPGETTAPTGSKPAGSNAPAKLNKDIYPIDFDGTLTVVTGKPDADKADNWVRWETWTGVDVEWRTVAEEQTPLLFLDDTQMPDIFFQAHGLSVPQINEYGQGGKLINFMDHLDKLPNISARYAEDPMMFDSVKDANGDVYTLPYICDTLTMCGNLFYVRTDMTDAAGWETLPKTTEEFLTMCEDLQNYYKDVPGYVPMVCNGAASIAYNGAYSNFFFPAFGDLMRADITTNATWDKIVVGFATEQFKHYLEFMNALYEEGYMDPECFVAEGNTGKAKLIEGSTTMNPYATYLEPKNFASGEMEFQTFPPLSSQYTSETKWANPNHYLQGTYMINAKCKELDAALAFLDACYSVEENPLNEAGTVWGISLWVGEKDVDYVVNKEEGSFKYLDHEGYDSPTNWLHMAGSGSAPYLKWPYYEASGSGQEKKALGTRDILMPHGVDVFYTTLLTLTQDEQDIYNDCWTDIDKKVTEMNAAFITGQADIEKDWDAYIASLNDMGLQDVIDIYQAALDRYNSK